MQFQMIFILNKFKNYFLSKFIYSFCQLLAIPNVPVWRKEKN